MELGRNVRDQITGFTGIVTGVVVYITGCNQSLVAPPVGADGKLIDAAWFDEQRLVYVDHDRITLDNWATPGMDAPAPKR
jgi:hypothetical protein